VHNSDAAYTRMTRCEVAAMKPTIPVWNFILLQLFRTRQEREANVMAMQDEDEGDELMPWEKKGSSVKSTSKQRAVSLSGCISSGNASADCTATP
jgi:hypothetical protein